MSPIDPIVPTGSDCAVTPADAAPDPAPYLVPAENTAAADPSPTRQNPTEPDTESPICPPSLTPAPPADPNDPADPAAATTTLTPRQLTALTLLTSGRSATSAAQSLGVHRSTLHAWKSNPAFAAELRRRQLDLARATDARLIRLLYHATHTALASLSHKDPDTSTRNAFRLMTILRPWKLHLDRLLADDPPDHDPRKNDGAPRRQTNP